MIPTSRATPRNTAVMVRTVRALRFGRLREAIFAESEPISACSSWAGITNVRVLEAKALQP